MEDSIDDIPITDFGDDLDEDFDFGDDDDMNYVGKKCQHVSGIEGVCTKYDKGYHWVTHNGGTESYIHGGELIFFGSPTAEELEIYLGHPNGLSAETKNTQG